jgi:hypothetical protein
VIFTEHDHARLATLFDGMTEPHPSPLVPYPGYKPEVREAPNGDTKACTLCAGTGRVNDSDPVVCPACSGACMVPNVDAGPAAKRYLHVAPKYNPPAWAMSYLARAHFEACRVATALGVSAAYRPHEADGTLRVLEYPSAACAPKWEGGMWCEHCGRYFVSSEPPSVCPVRAPGAGTVEHKDFDLFTIVLWRSTPDDLELLGDCRHHNDDARAINPDLHIGELGELVGLGPATPHRVPARPYTQRSLIYFAVPDHGAHLPHPVTFPASHTRQQVRVHTVGEWLDERTARSRY